MKISVKNRYKEIDVINFGVLIKGAKFKVCMSSGFERVELKKKQQNTKWLAAFLINIVILKKTSFRG